MTNQGQAFPPGWTPPGPSGPPRPDIDADHLPYGYQPTPSGPARTTEVIDGAGVPNWQPQSAPVNTVPAPKYQERPAALSIDATMPERMRHLEYTIFGPPRPAPVFEGELAALPSGVSVGLLEALNRIQSKLERLEQRELDGPHAP